MKQKPAEAKLWNKTFVLILAFEFVGQMGINLINPIVSNYAVWMGASYAVAGFLAGINAFVSFIVRPFASMPLRRFLRRDILIAVSALFFFSALLSAFVVTLPALGIQRVIFGAAFVFKSALVIAFASSVVPKDKLGQGVGYVGLANSVGAAAGPSLAAIISGAMGYPFTCGIAVVFFIAQVILMINVKDPYEAEQKESIASLKAKNKGKTRFQVFCSEFNLHSMLHIKTIPLALTFVFEAFVYGTVLMFVLLVGEERGTAGGTVFFAIYVIAACITRPFVARLYDKYGLKKIYIPAGILMVASLVVLAFANSVVGFVVASILLALGQGSLYPSAQSEGVRGRSTQESSLAVNTLYLGADIGMFIGPLISGVILEVSSSSVMFLANAAVTVVYIISLGLYCHWRAKDDALSATTTEATDAEALENQPNATSEKTTDGTNTTSLTSSENTEAHKE